MDDRRRALISWVGLLAVSLGLTLGLSLRIAHFVTSRPSSTNLDEASYLSRHGRPCLAGVPDSDVPLTPAFARGWSRLTEQDCRPGSWLVQFHELGQTLAQYQAEGPHRPDEDAPIFLAPLGELSERSGAGEEMIEPIREFLSLYFQRPAQLRDALPIPELAWSPARGAAGQYDAEALLESLKGTCPEGVVGCLHVTDQDLYVKTLQYVFGLGHFHRRVGVVSIHRLWEDQRDLTTGSRVPVRNPEPLRRALKVAVHELAHELTVSHCVHYRGCVMAGTNSLAESDVGSLMLCPLDHEKLRWSLRFDPHRRFTQLAEFARRHGLHAEARYWAEMAEATPPVPHASGAGR